MIGLVAAVILGGIFGSASAEIDSVEDSVMVVDLSVEVLSTTDTVVAHLSFEDDPTLTLPLLERGGGSFGITTELEAKNYLVTFEVVGEETSEPVSFVELGADLVPESGPTTTTEPGELSDASQRALWLAIALGAASLSVLAFWVLGGRDEKEHEEESVDPGEEE